VLEIRGLSKRFGGVVATDAVTLDIAEGEVHALIGPNGAGKSTLVAQLSGSLRPDAGEILFLGMNLTRVSQHARVRAGLARSFQVNSLFERSTVLDNLALAVQATAGSSLSFWRPVAKEATLFDAARSIAADVGLAERLHVGAGTLAHGEQRVLEVALALASRPRLVLLDEPMAGLGPQESRRMIELIERTKRRTAVLLVEHDMDAVFRLADRVSVLVDGRIIATGTPAQVRADAAVKRAYLGDDDAPAG
jgi:branched-chain amino acid transport system ATP-binding protein